MPDGHPIDHQAIADAVARMATSAVLGLGRQHAPSRDERLEVIAVSNTICDAARQAMNNSVAAARNDGCTWSEIGNVLGVTRQAAFRRFGRESG